MNPEFSLAQVERTGKTSAPPLLRFAPTIGLCGLELEWQPCRNSCGDS